MKHAKHAILWSTPSTPFYEARQECQFFEACQTRDFMKHAKHAKFLKHAKHTKHVSTPSMRARKHTI